MKIGIIGLGYVGLTLAVAAAANGMEVYGVETNQPGFVAGPCLEKDAYILIKFLGRCQFIGN